jgi:hypothetical protein
MFWGSQTLYIYLLKGGIARIYVCKKDDKDQCINHPGISTLLTTEFNLGLLKTMWWFIRNISISGSIG